MVNVVIEKNDAGQRLDRFMKKYLRRAPLSMIYKMIRKDVKVNGRRAKEDSLLNEGDEVTLYISDEKIAELSAPAENRAGCRKQFRTAYEDDNIIAVVKPKGLLTHGDSREKKNTLVNQVCGYLQGKGEYDPSVEKTFSPAPANRLGKAILPGSYSSARMRKVSGCLQLLYETTYMSENITGLSLQVCSIKR